MTLHCPLQKNNATHTFSFISVPVYVPLPFMQDLRYMKLSKKETEVHGPQWAGSLNPCFLKSLP